MAKIQIRYTRTKQLTLDDPFAVFEFEVYNEKDFETVLRNIEEHYDGVIIECDSMERPIPKRTRRKERRKYTERHVTYYR